MYDASVVGAGSPTAPLRVRPNALGFFPATPSFPTVFVLSGSLSPADGRPWDQYVRQRQALDVVLVETAVAAGAGLRQCLQGKGDDGFGDSVLGLTGKGMRHLIFKKGNESTVSVRQVKGSPMIIQPQPARLPFCDANYGQVFKFENGTNSLCMHEEKIFKSARNGWRFWIFAVTSCPRSSICPVVS